ncbi:MAG: 7-cyano-7-deazaguanine synthase QueC [Candidatus Omnitrophota bacterium]|nr:7-cyano-7-deazaguanine synthase QueC [Candidatus Omnitrophota bacterium]
MRKAIVLLSGGLDSTTTLFFALSKGYKVNCLIFDYGQRHKKEIKKAVSVCKKVNTPFKIVKLDLPWLKSSLVDKKKKLPSAGSRLSIPSTYVAGRNTIFLSYGLSWAESLKAEAVFIGANSLDYSGYPDCRPEYFKAFRKMAGLAAKSVVEGRKIKILTPLISRSKARIVRLGKRLGVPFEMTWSCYKGEKSICTRCDSCRIRAKGFQEAKIKDPLDGCKNL